MSSIPSPLDDPWERLDQLIRRDPARRGLIEAETVLPPLCPGHLRAACDHLARFGQTVWLITGFYIPGATPPAAETDGPPGTALLAAALSALGMRVSILTDDRCAACVTFAVEQYGLKPDTVITLPMTAQEVDAWTNAALAEPANRDLSHVIAIERVGPSYTLDDLGRDDSPASHWAEFDATVPVEHHDRCHNMRGVIIDEDTAPLHRVLEMVSAQRPGVRTVGVGDGGNEIGMGAIPWREIRRRLSGPAASLIPCRVATDWTILAGVSNWGAQALAAGCVARRNCAGILTAWTAELEEMRLRNLVAAGLAVDGVTRLYEPTVDGLPFLTYIQPWEGMRRLFLETPTSP